MCFKEWLLNETRKIKWDFATALPNLSVKDITSEPILTMQGSHADIYEHPTDKNKLIKITNDTNDAINTVNAQELNSKNVVKCYAHTTQGITNGIALLVDFVKGQSAPYSTPEFLGLLEGQYGDQSRNQAHLRILRPDNFRTNILQSHENNNKAELLKLSQLFKTIYLLEHRLNIFLADLSENIIDDGQNYVIVDFGR